MSASYSTGVSERPAEITNLEIEIARMAALVETNLADCIAAFERRDVASASQIIELDKRIDAHHHNIELQTIKMLEIEALTTQQIRETMMMVKLAADLERVGDLTKNISRRVCVIAQERKAPNLGGVSRMGHMCLQRFSDVLNAYAARDLIAAKAVWSGDYEVDELYHSVFRELVMSMRETPDQIGSATHMVFIAKNFERIGDHATNIAEALHFMMTGEQVDESRQKGSDTIVNFAAKEATPIHVNVGATDPTVSSK